MPGALQQSQEREASQQRRIEGLERELQAARAAAEAGGARETLSPGPPQTEPTPKELLNNHTLLSLADWADDAEDSSIPRPKGTITRLRAHMGIPHQHKPYYNAIRWHFGNRMNAGGIEWYLYYHQQDHLQVQKFLLLMRHEIPFLRRFAGNWASADIVRTILKNQRDERHRINLPQDVALQATSFRPRPQKRQDPPRSPPPRSPNDQTQPDRGGQPQPRPRRRPRSQEVPDDRSDREDRESPERSPAHARANNHENENENGGSNRTGRRRRNKNNIERNDKDNEDDVEPPRPKRSCRRNSTSAASASGPNANTASASTKSSAAAKPRGKGNPSRRAKASGSKSRRD